MIRTRPFATLDYEAIIDVLSDGLVDIAKEADELRRLLRLLNLESTQFAMLDSNVALLGAKATEHINTAGAIVRQHVNP